MRILFHFIVREGFNASLRSASARKWFYTPQMRLVLIQELATRGSLGALKRY